MVPGPTLAAPTMVGGYRAGVISLLWTLSLLVFYLTLGVCPCLIQFQYFLVTKSESLCNIIVFRPSNFGQVQNQSLL